jgi:hypothetical protein
MFLVNPEDQADLDLLRQLFPQGSLSLYESRVGKNFMLYMVPSNAKGTGLNPAPGEPTTP